MKALLSILLLATMFYTGFLTARADEPVHLTPAPEPIVPPRTELYLPYLVADFTEHYCDWLCGR